MFLPQSTQKLPMYPLSCKFLVWYDLWLPLEGQRAILMVFYITLDFSHFILNLSKFDLFGTIYHHSKIFFYVLTLDDLAKVKQSHSQMCSISNLHHNSMNKNPWKFHASTLIRTINSLIRPTNELWWPPKVKKGHGKTSSISGWIFIVWLRIHESFMILHQSTL